MSAAGATFTGPGGSDANTAIRAEVQALTTVTMGDLLYVGQVYRSRIRERTFKGVDVNGAPFVSYSTKGPYYFYPNRDSTGRVRFAGLTGPHPSPEKIAAAQKARKTASAGRFAKTGKAGARTPYGIRYESYAAAKAAHGVGNVNLYGMEQHTHMLDTMLVKAGGTSLDMSIEGLSGGDMAAFEGNQACNQLTLGFYGPEAERAKGQNEGNSKTPQREFFALSPEDLQLGERAIAERMAIRAKAGHGTSGSTPGPAPAPAGANWKDSFDLGF